MVFNRLWYNDGKTEPLISNPYHLTNIINQTGKGIHLCWRTSGTRIAFYNDQFRLLKKNLDENGLKIGSGIDKDSLLLIIKKLLHRNRVFKGALIHLFLIPPDEVALPNEARLFILTEESDREKYIINHRGLKLGWLKDQRHPGYFYMSRMHCMDPSNSLWNNELARLGLDAGYLTNNDHRIIECNDSSIFVIGGDSLFTPALSLGPVNRAIRDAVIKLAPAAGLKVIETDKLDPGHLDNADEIFIANDLKGIQWVVGHNKKRFFRNYSDMILNLLNHEWEQES